jgi:GNAT superfamily N-acetyltransferase
MSPSEADVPLIRQYLQQLARDEGVPHANAGDDFLRATLFGSTAVAVPHLLKWQQPAGQTAAVCGLAVHSWKWGPFSGTLDMYLHALYVEPSFRGQGIGKAAIAALSELARAYGASRIELLTTAGNQAAADFYEAQGIGAAQHMVVRRKLCKVTTTP